MDLLQSVMNSSSHAMFTLDREGIITHINRQAKNRFGLFNHSQYSHAAGRLEPGEDAVSCALRETWEELGIPRPAVEVVAELDWLTHQGGFVLYPVLGIVSPEAAERLHPGPAEVKETFFVPVDWLRAHPPEVYAYPLIPRVGEDFPYARIGFPQGYRWRGGRVEVPIYAWEGRAIWGLTGRITRRLLEGMP